MPKRRRKPSIPREPNGRAKPTIQPADEVVERVAKAIHEALGDIPYALTYICDEDTRRAARAALAAMGQGFATALPSIAEIPQISDTKDMSDWREISSAPKDGSIIWLGNAHWLRLGLWLEDRWADLAKVECRQLHSGLLLTPKHWMPAPKPPQADA